MEIVEAQSEEAASTLEALLIQTTRAYDALMMLLKHFDPAAASFLADYHEAGGTLSPNPAIVVEESQAVLGSSPELSGLTQE